MCEHRSSNDAFRDAVTLLYKSLTVKPVQLPPLVLLSTRGGEGPIPHLLQQLFASFLRPGVLSYSVHETLNVDDVSSNLYHLSLLL